MSKGVSTKKFDFNGESVARLTPLNLNVPLCLSKRLSSFSSSPRRIRTTALAHGPPQYFSQKPSFNSISISHSHCGFCVSQSKGLQKNEPIVCYDDAGGSCAARLWWMLRCLGFQEPTILEGGVPLSYESWSGDYPPSFSIVPPHTHVFLVLRLGWRGAQSTAIGPQLKKSSHIRPLCGEGRGYRRMHKGFALTTIMAQGEHTILMD